MKKQSSNVLEVMAPAGSYECLMAAVQGGANSVYFGVEQLNMRARSTNNFTLDDLVKIQEICAENNVKSYLTLNTILYDHDISLMKSIINKAKEVGISAVIAADHAAISYAAEIEMPVHVSTQANVTNLETVKFYSHFADVVVLARELSLKQIAEIVKGIERKQIKGPSGELIRIEVFAHGAFCMAVSGKCYLSLHSNFASANRGACVQNCRREYIVIDKEDGIELEIDNEYIMSAKDLCTIDFLDKLRDAGVSVYKIEGRGRAADYVYTTTKCYREAVDALNEDSFSLEKVEGWKARLSEVFNRGFWDGYYLGRQMGEWTNEAGSKATKTKIYIGKGMKYYEEQGVAEFKIESHDVSVGDEILITGPTTGVIQTTIESLRADDVDAQKAKKGSSITFKLPQKIRPSDKLYKLVKS